MAEELGAAGLVQTSIADSPDVVVINTCTVTREATKASRMAIRRAVKANPDARVVVVGCYAVSDRAEIEAIDGVDLVLGNNEKESFAAALGLSTSSRPVLQIGLPSDRRVGPIKVRANLKAQTGCDEWCTFCIIPTTRGELRSMNEDDLVSEARRRVAAGARELVLTGVHLGKYTYDAGGDERSLIRLFERLLSIEGVWRVRLSSILSRHLTDDVVSFIAAEPRICRYLHVPLQSGDEAILEAMNRPYRLDEYVSAVEGAKAAIPGVALATDVIVGFPGESDDAFENTMEVVQRIGFSKLHVFRYSAREGTAAAALPDVVHPDVKKARSKRLIHLGNELRTDFLKDHLDRPLEVLVEDEREVEGAGVCSGQTSDFVRVWFEGSGLMGSMVEVVADRVRADGLGGRAVSVKLGGLGG